MTAARLKKAVGKLALSAETCWSNGHGGSIMEHFDFDRNGFHVEVRPGPEWLDLSVTLPSAEEVQCRYNRGKLVSLLIDRVVVRGAHGDLTMVETEPIPLSPDVRAVAMQAVTEFLNQT